MKHYLNSKNVPFQEINVTEVPEAVEDVMNRVGEFISLIIVYRNPTFKPKFATSNNPVIDLDLNNLQASKESR